jgi:hypothetical protein
MKVAIIAARPIGPPNGTRLVGGGNDVHLIDAGPEAVESVSAGALARGGASVRGNRFRSAAKAISCTIGRHRATRRARG